MLLGSPKLLWTFHINADRPAHRRFLGSLFISPPTAKPDSSRESDLKEMVYSSPAGLAPSPNRSTFLVTPGDLTLS